MVDSVPSVVAEKCAKTTNWLGLRAIFSRFHLPEAANKNIAKFILDHGGITLEADRVVRVEVRQTALKRCSSVIEWCGPRAECFVREESNIHIIVVGGGAGVCQDGVVVTFL